jgi:Tfp pilus assembly protein PilF
MLLLLIGSCAMVHTEPVGLTATQWSVAVQKHGVDPTRVANPLGYTREMKRAAYVAAGDGAPFEQLRRLQDYLFHHGEQTFDYESRLTLTAAEAFEQRSGNCVSFTNMFIALARSLGIPAQPALVLSWEGSETDGNLSLVTNHVVAVFQLDERWAVYDFYRSRVDAPVHFRPVDDLWNTAIYLNNIGVAALRDGRLDEAQRILENASRLAPDWAELHSNLGVIRRRQGDVWGALDSYLLALQIEPDSTTIRSNLFGLFLGFGVLDSQSDVEGVEPTLEAVLSRAETQFARGELRDALRLYRRARQKHPQDPEPLMLMARCHLLLGQVRGARRALTAALEVDPSHDRARYLLDSLDRTLPAIALQRNRTVHVLPPGEQS